MLYKTTCSINNKEKKTASTCSIVEVRVVAAVGLGLNAAVKAVLLFLPLFISKFYFISEKII